MHFCNTSFISINIDFFISIAYSSQLFENSDRDSAKVVFRRKFMATNIPIRKQEGLKTNAISVKLKRSGKKQSKHKKYRRR